MNCRQEFVNLGKNTENLSDFNTILNDPLQLKQTFLMQQNENNPAKCHGDSY